MQASLHFQVFKPFSYRNKTKQLGTPGVTSPYLSIPLHTSPYLSYPILFTTSCSNLKIIFGRREPRASWLPTNIRTTGVSPHHFIDRAPLKGGGHICVYKMMGSNPCSPNIQIYSESFRYIWQPLWPTNQSQSKIIQNLKQQETAMPSSPKFSHQREAMLHSAPAKVQSQKEKPIYLPF